VTTIREKGAHIVSKLKRIAMANDLDLDFGVSALLEIVFDFLDACSDFHLGTP